jgi:hypothetical protein
VYLAREVAEKLKRSQLRIRRLSKDLRDNKSSIRRARLMVLGVLPRKRPTDRGKRARSVRKEWTRKRRLETSRGWYGSLRARNRLKPSLLRTIKRRMRRQRLRSY